MAFNRSNYQLYLSGAQLKKLISRVLGVSERSINGLPVRGALCRRFDSSFLPEGKRRDVYIRFKVGLVPFVLNLSPDVRVSCYYHVHLGVCSAFRETICYSDKLGYVDSDACVFYPEVGSVDDATRL